MTPQITKSQKNNLITRFKHQQALKLQALRQTLATKTQSQKERTLRRKLLIPMRLRELKITEVINVERVKKVRIWDVIRDVMAEREKERLKIEEIKSVENNVNFTESEKVKRARRIEEIRKWREAKKE